MPTTTKMGIVYPSSTDLVKDGATAMGTISTTVDSKTGLVLISTTPFSAVSSVSLPNNSFTSSFDNYRLLIQIDSVSANLSVTGRMRLSGTDATGASDYYSHQQFASSTTVSASAASASSFNLNSVNTTTTYVATIDLFNPALAKKTYGLYQNLQYSSSGAWFLNYHGLNHQLTTAYDSFSVIASTGNFTGTIWLFGYNK